MVDKTVNVSVPVNMQADPVQLRVVASGGPSAPAAVVQTASSHLSLWLAIAGLATALAIVCIVGLWRADIAELRTEVKIATVQTEAEKKITALEAKTDKVDAKADAVLATARHELTDEARIIRDELKDGLAKKLDKSDFDEYKVKAAAMSAKRRAEAIAALKAIGDEVNGLGNRVNYLEKPKVTKYQFTGSVTRK